MKKTVSTLSALLLALALILAIATPALAQPSFTTDATKLTAANVTVKASSGWQNAIYVTVQTDDTDDYLKQFQFTINWVQGTFDGGEIAEVAIYKSTDATLVPAGDELVDSKLAGAINYGVATTFSWVAKGALNDFEAAATDYWFYLVFRTSATWSDNGAGADDTINISMAAADVVLRDVSAAGDINSANTPTTDNFIADTTAPTVTGAGPPSLNDSWVGIVTPDIMFSENMNTTINPTVTITGLTTDPYNLVFDSWPNPTTWRATFNFNDDNEEAVGTYNISGAQDAAGNTMVADSSHTVPVDTKNPTVVIASVAPDPTNTSPIPVTATFSENVVGFVVGDITVGNGAAGNFVPVSGLLYTFDVTPAGQGLVTVDIGAGVAQDTATNPNTAAAQFSITYDSVAPTVEIASVAPDPTITSPIPVTATFSENVVGFVVGDITVGNGAAGNFVPVSGLLYTFDVTPAGQGLVTVDIGAGVAQDAATNPNTAAAQFTITYVVPYGGGGGGGATASGTGSLNLSNYLNSQGRAIYSLSLTSTDGLVNMSIPWGTLVLDAQGNPLASIQIVVLSTPPPPPGCVLVGHAYDCLPAGANFQPAITLTFKYAEADIPDGVSEQDLVLAYWDGDQWVNLPTTVNAIANIATGKVAHFTPVALIASAPTTGAPQEEAPPEGVPPEGAPPEGAPQEEAPPEGVPQGAEPLNVWIMVGIMAAAVVLSLIIFMLGKRRA